MSNPSTHHASTSPADQLIGRILDGGWQVAGRLNRPAGATGGNFSICYHVENVDSDSPYYGQQGFLKALDYTAALQHPDVPSALQQMTEEYNFERSLVDLCKERRMRHIVRGIESGEAVVTGFGPITRVNYLIFEAAKYDIRWALSLSTSLDVAWRFATLHNVANGLQQLHSADVSHQDIKPSNVLEFGERRKIGDLGRAHRSGVRGPHDDHDIPGDHGYAAIELLYGYVHNDERARRRANDCYQLGGLMFFLFAGVSLTTAILMTVDPSHQPAQYGGDYRQVVPELRIAFDSVVQRLQSVLPQSFHDRGLRTFRELSDPDILERGIPQYAKGTVSRFRLDRYVSHFDLLAKQARIAAQAALR